MVQHSSLEAFANHQILSVFYEDLVNEFNYNGSKRIHDVREFIEDRFGIIFDLIANKEDWSFFVMKKPSMETIKEFGYVEPRLIDIRHVPDIMPDYEILEIEIYNTIFINKNTKNLFQK